MWIPNNEQDIINAVTTNSLEETIIFDAKKEIPPKNVDVAKDVSAMANTAGGVILFGVEEDASGRPSILSPFELKGQREKIDSIIRTSISEIPVFNISAIESHTDSAKGYIVLVIPPSERAPHQVIVKGDRRFYGRGETGNYVLSEPEIARLYERRQLSTQNLLPVLKEQIKNAPITEHRGFVHLHLVIKPVLEDDTIIERARQGFSKTVGYTANESMLFSQIGNRVSESDIFQYDHYGIAPSSLHRWIHQTDG